jgi:hypothetical protein
MTATPPTILPVPSRTPTSGAMTAASLASFRHASCVRSGEAAFSFESSRGGVEADTALSVLTVAGVTGAWMDPPGIISRAGVATGPRDVSLNPIIFNRLLAEWKR